MNFRQKSKCAHFDYHINQSAMIWNSLLSLYGKNHNILVSEVEAIYFICIKTQFRINGYRFRSPIPPFWSQDESKATLKQATISKYIWNCCHVFISLLLHLHEKIFYLFLSVGLSILQIQGTFLVLPSKWPTCSV